MELIFFFLLVVFGYVSVGAKDLLSKRALHGYSGLIKKNTIEIFFSLLALLFLIFIVACRNFYSYVDTAEYTKYFYLFKDKGIINFKTHTEVGYNIVTYAFGIFKTPLPLNIFYTSIIYVLTYKFILKYSSDYLMSIVLFFCIYFIYSANIVRQMVATAILLAALDKILDGEEIFAILLIGIATLFHKTALLFVVVIFFKYLAAPKKVKNYILLVIATVGILFVVGYVFRKTRLPYASYIVEYLGFFKQKIAYVFIDLICIYFLYKLKKTDNWSILIWLQTCVLIFDILSIRVGLLSRVGGMMGLFSVAILPTAISANKKIKFVSFYKSVIIAIFVLFFFIKLEFSELRGWFPWEYCFNYI